MKSDMNDIGDEALFDWDSGRHEWTAAITPSLEAMVLA